MLSLSLEDNRAIETAVFGAVLPYGERVALYESGKPIGIAVFGINSDGTEAHLYRVGIIEGERGKRYGDFFIRAMLYKLVLSGLDISVPVDDERLRKFGFLPIDGGMRVKNEELTFPSACMGENHD